MLYTLALVYFILLKYKGVRIDSDIWCYFHFPRQYEIWDEWAKRVIPKKNVTLNDSCFVFCDGQGNKTLRTTRTDFWMIRTIGIEFLHSLRRIPNNFKFLELLCKHIRLTLNAPSIYYIFLTYEAAHMVIDIENFHCCVLVIILYCLKL